MNSEANPLGASTPTGSGIPGSGIRALPERGPESDGATGPFAALYSPGQILAGKYRVDRHIGEGSMGVVLAATHLGLSETVAIKFIRPDARELPGVLERFGTEAKVAARIKSEHVIRVLDVGSADPIGAYIVMEYLEGQSLGVLLEANGPLSVERAVEYLLQACEGLAAAHAIGVIHRDIKPENLFVTRHGNVEVLKLLDFGISKTALGCRIFGNDAPPNQTAFVMGTPLYMSPEQIRSDPNLDARTDVWSMGAVLFELLTAKSAFAAGSVTEICSRILDSPPLSLPADMPGRNAALEKVIQRCLEKDPAQRYQSVVELAQALMPLGSASARSYAARASCILTASGLNLDLAERAPAPVSTSPSRTRRASIRRGLVGLAAFAGISSGLLAITAPSSEPKVVAPLPMLAASPLGARSLEGPPDPDLTASIGAANTSISAVEATASTGVLRDQARSKGEVGPLDSEAKPKRTASRKVVSRPPSSIEEATPSVRSSSGSESLALVSEARVRLVEDPVGRPSSRIRLVGMPTASSTAAHTSGGAPDVVR
jgi:serine/threonine protein kinase